MHAALLRHCVVWVMRPRDFKKFVTFITLIGPTWAIPRRGAEGVCQTGLPSDLFDWIFLAYQ